MSYDLEVFSVSAAPLPPLPSADTWRIAAAGPLPVDSEDIPSEVRKALPGIRFLVQLHLEGDAPAAAVDDLLEVARGLARRARGVIVDQQTCTIETPRGVHRLTVESAPAAESLVQISWFTMASSRFTAALPGELLDLFERTLPNLLPRRYDWAEPPQFRLETDGLGHFRSFLARHVRDPIVWKCQRPCRDVHVEVPVETGPTRRGFRCNRLTVDVDGVVMGDAAWRVELFRLWLSVADLIHPFYAEVRVGTCPTSSWWWNGVPCSAPSAVLIGPPYIDLWPAFSAAASVSLGGLLFQERLRNLDDGDREPLPAPPPAIAQPPSRLMASDPATGEVLSVVASNDIQYPPTWPFDGPRRR